MKKNLQDEVMIEVFFSLSLTHTQNYACCEGQIFFNECIQELHSLSKNFFVGDYLLLPSELKIYSMSFLMNKICLLGQVTYGYSGNNVGE